MQSLQQPQHQHHSWQQRHQLHQLRCRRCKAALLEALQLVGQVQVLLLAWWACSRMQTLLIWEAAWGG
jgi:hypothetical protein